MTPKRSAKLLIWPPTWSPKMMPTWLNRQVIPVNGFLNGLRHWNWGWRNHNPYQPAHQQLRSQAHPHRMVSTGDKLVSSSQGLQSKHRKRMPQISKVTRIE
ncbi:hypothetical protein TNCV_274421 [Trichonephila clavipes]|nr:hypothetical protein TNCV_274421 [Trichonephila clavipes]